ncbi:hypothetical protein H2203_008876 [Taxawa tesnikishii (nom. ined.)]|nr:hypothetical protein H2203_008876 [Dothideales sp. JES 119]
MSRGGGPKIPCLAQSESKQKFLERLNLSADVPEHANLYRLMKEDAGRGCTRINEDRNSLLPELRGNPAIKPPFTNSQVTATAMHRETLRIYREAGAKTKPYYDLGHDRSGLNEENWIIKWLLWHVFRYRDSRNRNRAPAASPSPMNGTTSAPARSILGSRPQYLRSVGSNSDQSEVCIRGHEETRRGKVAKAQTRITKQAAPPALGTVLSD